VTNATRKGYRASQNGDGTWDIYDVPIYAENVRSFGLIPVLNKKTGEVAAEELVIRHDAKWLQKSIETAQLDYEERGYRAPLHINHHGKGEKVEEAGEIMPRYVTNTLYEGKLLATLFADLHNVPQAAYELIKAKRLRYRSVEVSSGDDEKPEIKGLALLPHQPPHFKLPPLVVEDAPVTAAYGSKAGLQMLCHFDSDTDMTKDKVKSKQASGGQVIDDNRDVVASDDTNADLENKGAGGSEDGQEDSKDLKSKGGFMDKLLLLITAMAAKMGIGVDEKAAMPKGPAEQPKGDETRDPLALNPAYAAKALPMASFDPSEWMQMKAKMAAYDARFAAVDADTNAKGAVEKALADLKGFNVTDKMRTEMIEAAKLGEKPLAMYVSTIKTYGIKDPPKDPLAGGLAFSKDPYPAEVLAYQSKGEAVLAKAVEGWQGYKAMGDRVAHIKLEDWLKINVAANDGGNFFGN
jgi:hypothetical protein